METLLQPLPLSFTLPNVSICGSVEATIWDNGELFFDQELLRQWVVLEYETLKRERLLAISAFKKVVALAHNVRQLVLFVDVLESQVTAIVLQL